MLTERIARKASVYDFDDTLIGRGLMTRVLGLVGGKIFSHRLPDTTRAEIAKMDINHNRVNAGVLDWKERASLESHSRRDVLPGVKTMLEERINQGVDIYGNTGRSSKAEWVDVTDETLKRGGIRDCFKGIFYTQEGIKTAISKAHGLHLVLEGYDEVDFYEDDPRTARFLAAMFPGVQFNLVHYRSTGLLIPRRELENYPNLRFVEVLGAGYENRTRFSTLGR